MTNFTSIVSVSVSLTQAPAPNTLQKSGALLTQGGSNTAPGTLTLCSTLSNLVSILAPVLAITSMTETSNVVTATTTSPHGWNVADIISVTIAGVTPSGYNGTFQATVTGASTFTYPLAASPGAVTIEGTAILAAVNELLQMGTTYFAQSAAPPVWVLELGESDPAAGPALLTAFITSFGNRMASQPPGIYSYLVPREWDGLSQFLAMIINYNANGALTYFYVTTTVANRAIYAGNKSVFALVESPNVAATEFSLASVFAVTLSASPSSTNRVTPLSYSFLFGVTAYPTPGNANVFTELATANVGWVGTGAEGGLTNTICFQGQFQDGKPWNFWYGADWANINCHLATANEVINGSNNPLAPLDYDQNGINRLQNRVAQTMGSAITNGLANGVLKTYQLPAATFATNFENGLYVGQIAVNAEPYFTYVAENPNDYGQGVYNGIAIADTPARGFLHVSILLNVTTII